MFFVRVTRLLLLGEKWIEKQPLKIPQMLENHRSLERKCMKFEAVPDLCKVQPLIIYSLKKIIFFGFTLKKISGFCTMIIKKTLLQRALIKFSFIWPSLWVLRAFDYETCYYKILGGFRLGWVLRNKNCVSKKNNHLMANFLLPYKMHLLKSGKKSLKNFHFISPRISNDF